MRKYRKVLIFILVITIGFFLNRKLQLSSYLTRNGNFEQVANFIYNNYLLSIFLYLIFTIIGSSVLALPGVTFAVVASGLFGPWLGSVYCLIGVTIGSVLSFLLSRYLLKGSVKGLVEKNRRLHDIIFQIAPEKEMLILMITRLLPIFPFNLQNFAYGITNIPIVKYTIGTFIFMIPGIITFSMVTEGIMVRENRDSMFFSVLLAIIFMAAIGVYLYKKYKILTIRDQNER